MLLLDDASPEGPFLDHLDPQLRYALPTRLAPAGDPDAPADVYLMLYRNSVGEQRGGLLRLRLEGEWAKPEDEAEVEVEPDAEPEPRAPQSRPVSLERSRFRLRVRTTLDGEPATGPWQPAGSHGADLVDVLVSLSDEEAQLASVLTARGEEAVEVEAELSFIGLRPIVSWLVRGSTAAIKQGLAAAVTAPVFDWPTLLGAIRSLPVEGGPLVFEPLGDDVEPDHDALLTEVALRAQHDLWTRIGADFRWVGPSQDDPEELVWDLRTRVAVSSTVLRTFSLSRWFARLSDEARARHLQIITDIAPFQPATLHVINAVPTGSGPIASVTVDLRYPGPTGLPAELRAHFPTDDGATTWRAQVIRQSMTPFSITSRVTHVIQGPDGPVIFRGPWVTEDGLVVTVDAARLGLRLVRVSAEPAVFDEAGSIEITAWTAEPEPDLLPRDPVERDPMSDLPVPPAWTGTLSAEVPETWVSVRVDDDLRLTVLARPPEGSVGTPVTLHDGPVDRDVFEIAAHRLQSLDPVEIRFTRAQTPTPLAWLGVALAPAQALREDEGELHTLEPGEQAVFKLFAPSVFRPPSYRYQVRWIALDDAGRALPMAQTDWIESDAPAHEVGLDQED